MPLKTRELMRMQRQAPALVLILCCSLRRGGEALDGIVRLVYLTEVSLRGTAAGLPAAAAPTRAPVPARQSEGD